eukprot:Hpha_TRINITY_DN698_c0_g1::TRINITY_DN698_c0_g1_i1::g.21388::m.21388
MEDIAAQLEAAGLQDCVEALRAQEVCDLDTLEALTDDDLESLVPDADRRAGMLAALGCAPPPPPPPPPPPQPQPPTAPPERRPSTSQPSMAVQLQRYRRLLHRRGDLLKARGGGGADLEEVEAELEELREQLGLGTGGMTKELRVGEKVRLVRDARHIEGAAVAGGQHAVRWAGHGATIEALCEGGVLLLRLPNNRTCRLRADAIIRANDRRPRGPTAREGAAEEEESPRPQSPDPRRNRPKTSQAGASQRNTQASASQPSQASPHRPCTATRERGWGKPAAARRGERRAAEALRYSSTRARREDPYCLQGNGLRVVEGMRRRPKAGVRSDAPRALCSVELLLLPSTVLADAGRVLRSAVWLSRGILADSVANGTRSDPQAHALRCAATASPSVLAPIMFRELCDGQGAIALSCAFAPTSGETATPRPMDSKAPEEAATAQPAVSENDSPPDIQIPTTSPTPGPDTGCMTPTRAASLHRRRSGHSRRRGSRASTAQSPVMSVQPPRVQEEMRVRGKIASSKERAARLRSELVKAQEIRAVQQRRLAEEELRHGRACALSSELLEFNGTVCSELGKLWQALEEVVRTLGQFSSQWARQLQSASDPTTSWMGRGVLSELMASSAEILERMRELKRLRRLASRDPCRRPGDGLTGRPTMLREGIWEVTEP